MTGSQDEYEFEHQLAEVIHRQMSVWDARVQDRSSATPRPPSAFPAGMAEHVDEDVTLCWRAIATAGEHAAMPRVQMDAEAGGVRIKPHLTLARTVMMGAAKAIYALERDDVAERRVRAMRLLYREYSDASYLMNDFMDHFGDVGEDPDWRASFAAVQDRMAYYESALGPYGYTRRKRNLRPTDTLLLEEAAHVLEGIPKRELAVDHLWRLSSGFAHASSWAWDAAAAGLEAQPIVAQFVTIWSPPLGMLDVAWNLWNRRRGR